MIFNKNNREDPKRKEFGGCGRPIKLKNYGNLLISNNFDYKTTNFYEKVET